MKAADLYRHWKNVLNYRLDRLVERLDKIQLRLFALQPDWLQQRLRSVLRTIGDLCWLVKTIPRVDAYRYTGPDWSVTYIGDKHNVLELQHVLFSETPEARHEGRVFLWRLPKVVSQKLAGVDLVVCELSRLMPPPWRPRAAYTFTSPPWIRQRLDIARPLDTIVKCMHQDMRRNLRRMQKTGYTYEFSQRLTDLDLFYHQMYLPFIDERHGERALIEPLEHVRKTFMQGGLILVKHEGNPVAGMLCRGSGNTYFPRMLGVRTGYHHLLPKGVIFALYWFTLDWAQRHGFHTLDLGSSRARQTDGVFRFKRNWQAQVVSDFGRHTEWTFISQNLPSRLCDHLSQQGFITEKGDAHFAVALTDQADMPSEREIAHYQKAASQNGLDGVAVVFPRGQTVITPMNSESRSSA